LEGRLAMTDAAAQFALASSPKLLSEWTTLHDKVRKKKELRNKIVHFDMAFNKRASKPIPYLTVKPYDARTAKAYPDGNGPKFTKRQIERFRDDFFVLSQSLAQFCSKIPPP
jgi:hypothetical protein